MDRTAQEILQEKYRAADRPPLKRQRTGPESGQTTIENFVNNG